MTGWTNCLRQTVCAGWEEEPAPLGHHGETGDGDPDYGRDRPTGRDQDRDRGGDRFRKRGGRVVEEDQRQRERPGQDGASQSLQTMHVHTALWPPVPAASLVESRFILSSHSPSSSPRWTRRGHQTGMQEGRVGWAAMTRRQ